MGSRENKKRAQKQSTSPVKPPAEAPPKASFRRKLIRLVMGVIVIPAVLLGLTELGLRLGGYGYPTGFFVKMPDQPAYSSNLQFGWRFFPRAISRPPLPLRLPEDKGDNAYRIFVLGGSAAQGFPLPAFGVDRVLSVMLKDAYPQVDWQVVNVAMTAINSHVVLPIARDCAKQQPDMFIVYLGNNEVVGPYGAGTVLGAQVPSMAAIRTGLAMQTMKIGQLVSVLGEKLRGSGTRDLTEWRGMTMFLDKQVQADDPRMATVYEHFATNLTDICEAGIQAGAEVLLSTVAVNLKDCPPFGSQHRSDLGQADLARWQHAYDAGDAAERANDHAGALEHFLAARRIDDRYAELPFRLGRCFLALGRTDEALKAYQAARDLDTLRFRADTRINDTIRDVASQFGAGQVHLVDTEERFRQVAATPQLPGNDLFFEHVHLEFAGTYQLASLLFQQIVPLLPAEVVAKADPPAQPLSEDQCAEHLALTLWERQLMLQNIMDVTEKAPFTGQLDHAQDRQARRDQCLDLKRRQTFPAAQEARRIYRQAIARWPDDMTLHYNFALLLLKLQDDQAEQHMRLALQELPDNRAALLYMGAILLATGKTTEAEASFQRLLDTSPDRAVDHAALARLFHGMGRSDKAAEHASASLDILPDQPGMLQILGSSLLDTQEFQKAIPPLKRATQLNPNSVDPHYFLALAMGQAGRHAEAVQCLRQAIQADPYSFWPRLLQADMFASQGNTAQAEKYYLAAIDIQPDAFIVRRTYIRLLTNQARYADAIEQYRKAAEYQPMDPEVLTGLASLLAMCPDTLLQDPDQAFEYAQLADLVTHHRSPAVLEVLAITYARIDQFDQAIATLEKAILLANAANDHDHVAKLKHYISIFQSAKP